MNIHSRIKQLQNNRNWSINHMAMEANISPGTILNWFKRKSIPTIEGIQNLCNAFGITLSEFFNECGDDSVYLSQIQKELLSEFDLLDKREKEDIIRLIKTRNEIRKESPL
ncbi:MAG: helix-turn-helix transcriptional regulator [Clostridia bacterium]|nr:helix-turn-helix transcriptional regulator [Clostridia bacterium]